MVNFIKLIVVLGAIGYGVKHFVLAEKSESEKVVDYIIMEFNEKKDQKIDSDTLIKGARKTRNGIAIDYHLINLQHLPQGIKKFQQEMEQKIISNNCHKKAITDVIDMGIEVMFVFYDGLFKRITDVVLNQSNCG